jgi:hypothetical protein
MELRFNDQAALANFDEGHFEPYVDG